MRGLLAYAKTTLKTRERSVGSKDIEASYSHGLGGRTALARWTRAGIRGGQCGGSKCFQLPPARNMKAHYSRQNPKQG